MPILEVSMFPEKGMDIQKLQEALIKKASLEIVRINARERRKRVVSWEARPSFSELSKDGMILRWHYKQYNKT